MYANKSVFALFGASGAGCQLTEQWFHTQMMPHKAAARSDSDLAIELSDLFSVDFDSFQQRSIAFGYYQHILSLLITISMP